jgi:hypothetical protein
MLYVCPKRGCSGTFNLSEHMRGETVTCRKCGAVLRFTGDTLLVVEPGADAIPTAEMAGPPQEFSSMSQPLIQDGPAGAVSTVLFAVGAVTVIVFLFMPLIDHAQLVRERAAIDIGDQKQLRNERRAGGGRGGVFDPDVRDKDKPTDADEKKRREERDSWEKKRKELEEQVDELRTSNQRVQPVYTWGMLIGMLFLAVASILYLSPRQSGARRIVGAVVISAEVLLIFIVYMIRSTAVTPLN